MIQVKIVRETMNRSLEMWKEVPGVCEEVSSPSPSKSPSPSESFSIGKTFFFVVSLHGEVNYIFGKLNDAFVGVL